MARVKFKQKCSKCNKNYVLTSSRHGYMVCYECQKEEMNQPINDPEMKDLFNIPEEYYKHNYFLRNIKVNYIRYKNLSENQINAFKKTVIDVKKELEDMAANPPF